MFYQWWTNIKTGAKWQKKAHEIANAFILSPDKYKLDILIVLRAFNNNHKLQNKKFMKMLHQIEILLSEGYKSYLQDFFEILSTDTNVTNDTNSLEVEVSEQIKIVF